MSWFLSGYVSGCQTYCYNDKSLNHKILVGRGLWTSSSAIPTTQRRTSFKVCPGHFPDQFWVSPRNKDSSLSGNLSTTLIQTLYRFFSWFATRISQEAKFLFVLFCSSLERLWLHLLKYSDIWRQKSDPLSTFPSSCWVNSSYCSSHCTLHTPALDHLKMVCLQFVGICLAGKTPKRQWCIEVDNVPPWPDGVFLVCG